MEAVREKFGSKATQADIAELVGIKQPSVAGWAFSSPDIKNAVALSEGTGVCVQWLYSEEGPKHPWDTQAHNNSTLTAILELANSLSKEGQLALLANAKFIRDHGAAAERPSKTEKNANEKGSKTAS